MSTSHRLRRAALATTFALLLGVAAGSTDTRAEDDAVSEATKQDGLYAVRPPGRQTVAGQNLGD